MLFSPLGQFVIIHSPSLFSLLELLFTALEAGASARCTKASKRKSWGVGQHQVRNRGAIYVRQNCHGKQANCLASKNSWATLSQFRI